MSDRGDFGKILGQFCEYLLRTKNDNKLWDLNTLHCCDHCQLNKYISYKHDDHCQLKMTINYENLQIQCNTLLCIKNI